MCGIAGVVSLSEPYQHPENIIKSMTDSLVHRGPDDHGYFIDERIALGHRRLSIIDLSQGAHQPMTCYDRYWISYNGEVYNFKEIRRELTGLGVSFNSESDTEVVIKAFAHWGIKFVDRLNGMFAICLYDSRTKDVYLLRDRLGIKPLYYTKHKDKLIFASEIKAILKYPGIESDFSVQGIESFLSYRYPICSNTFYKGINTLEPGHYCKVEGSNIEKVKYWDLPYARNEEDKGEEYYIGKTKELLDKSIQYRMIADVKIGAYLSGGVDSSGVVALMSQHTQEQIKTFTIGFEEAGYNEFEYSKQVANQYGTEHHEMKFSPGDYFTYMERLISYKDGPLGVANEPALYKMSEELKKHFTVVLSGEGADEIFGGYGKIFRSAFDFDRYSKGGVSATLEQNLKAKYGEVLPSNIAEHFFSQYRYITKKDQSHLLSSDLIQGFDQKHSPVDQIFEDIFENSKHLSSTDQFMRVFEKLHLPGLLNRVDVTTMATSVEARVPFVDHNLVEFAMSVPHKYKLKWLHESSYKKAQHLNASQISEVHDIPKYLLKKALEPNLPENILYRKKMGFPVPVHKWLGGKFKEISYDYLLSQKSKERNLYNCSSIEKLLNSDQLLNDHASGLKLWMLLNIEMWIRNCIDKN